MVDHYDRCLPPESGWEASRSSGEDHFPAEQTLQRERNTAIAYTRDLHERLRPEFEAIAREREETVRHLKPVPAQTEDEP